MTKDFKTWKKAMQALRDNADATLEGYGCIMYLNKSHFTLWGWLKLWHSNVRYWK